MKTICLLLLTILLSFHAIAQKKKATHARPTKARGDSLFAAGNYKEAVIAYEGVWATKSRPAGLRLALARTYAALNNNDRALVMIDSAITAGFNNVNILDTDPFFETVRKDARYAGLHERALDVAYPCRNLPQSRVFDFWLGDWDVYPTANPTFKTGFNRITKAAQGCVIVENWEATNGQHEGMSINYFDPVEGKWKQKWAGSGQDIQDFYDGEYADSAMRFKFIGRNPDGTPFTGRLTFTNMEPGKVRQHSERTGDEGKTWQTIYDLTYIRRAAGAKP